MTWDMNARPVHYLALAAIVITGVVIGQLVASALDISGVRRILLCSAATFVESWVALGVLLLHKRCGRTHRFGREATRISGPESLRPIDQPVNTKGKTSSTRLAVALTGLFVWVPLAAAFAIVNPQGSGATMVEVGLIVGSSLVAFTAVIVFASHALSNDALSPSQRRSWALLLIFIWPSAGWYWVNERRRGRDSAARAPQ